MLLILTAFISTRPFFSSYSFSSSSFLLNNSEKKIVCQLSISMLQEKTVEQSLFMNEMKGEGHRSISRRPLVGQ